MSTNEKELYTYTTEILPDELESLLNFMHMLYKYKLYCMVTSYYGGIGSYRIKLVGEKKNILEWHAKEDFDQDFDEKKIKRF